MDMPLIRADLGELKRNAGVLLNACHVRGVTLAAVTKAVCADPVILSALAGAGVILMADSRVQNLARVPDNIHRMLLRVADPFEAEEVVRCSEYSLQSGTEAIRALGAAARKLKRTHQIVLMIDLGDLREGILYSDEARILETAGEAAREEGLELAGVGTNLTCFGGILPDERNLGLLIGIAEKIRKAFRIPLPIVSGGNSSSLHLLLEGRLPAGVNQLRIGESLLLGTDTSCGEPFPQLSQRVFTVSARLVEVQDKPSRPVGSTGPNAFGEPVSFPDLGPMRRGILAIGRQDTDPQSLFPLDQDIRVLGASSDHLIVDLTHAKPYRVGDVLDFTPGYGALLKAYTSPYVRKTYINIQENDHHA